MLQKLLAEFVGTLVFMYAILASPTPYLIGAVFLGVILLIGGVSGGHINPIVSVMMFMMKKINMQEMIGYIISQGAGMLVATELFKRVKLF
jgi:aquaporin Z